MNLSIVPNWKCDWYIFDLFFRGLERGCNLMFCSFKTSQKQDGPTFLHNWLANVSVEICEMYLYKIWFAAQKSRQSIWPYAGTGVPRRSNLQSSYMWANTCDTIRRCITRVCSCVQLWQIAASRSRRRWKCKQQSIEQRRPCIKIEMNSSLSIQPISFSSVF